MRPHVLIAALCATASAAPAFAQDFPLAIAHKFGSTVIEEQPERIASVDYNGADNLLALGIQPVTIRDWYGDRPRAVWPWAEPLLEDTPEILRGTLNFEQIAAAEPDVILALWSGIDAEDYAKLSKIAPVVAVPEGVGDYALPWDDLALIAGRATGREELAEARVDEIQARFDGIAEAHPDWDGKTAAVAYNWDGALGAYTSQDIRPQLLARLGLETPEPIDAAADEGAFALTFSEERLDLIDADVLIWFTQGDRAEIEDLALRPHLDAVKEGREIFADEQLVSAFSHGSLLSLPYALDRLEPMIAAAIDGDPTTEVPSE